MVDKDISRQSWKYLLLFIGGLLLHVLCVRVFVHYIGETWVIWTDGVIQSLITIITVYGLGRLLLRYQYLFSDYQRVALHAVRRYMYTLFWLTFVIYLLAWPISEELLRITGWAYLAATFLTIGVLFWHVRFTLLPLARKKCAEPLTNPASAADLPLVANPVPARRSLPVLREH